MESLSAATPCPTTSVDRSCGRGCPLRRWKRDWSSAAIGGTFSSALPYGGFDKDRNGLLDWWERQSGLSDVAEPHGEVDDSDGDGMINLHEFWAGTDPLECFNPNRSDCGETENVLVTQEE